MKKSNLMLQAAVAAALLGMASAASAVSSVSATSATYATEQFNGSAAVATVNGNNISVTAGTAIPAGSIYTVALTLNGGTWAGNGVASATGWNSVMTPASGNSAGTVLLIPVTLSAASSVGLGANAMTLQNPIYGASNLATAGATTTLTSTIYTGTVTSANLATATVYDATSAATTVATSAKGTTVAIAANTSTAKIDLTAATPSTVFTSTTASATETGSTTLFKLGRVTITDSGASTSTLGTWVGGASNTNIATTLTAPAGFFAALGTTGQITLKAASAVNACAGANSGASTAFTLAASAAAATSVSFNGTAASSNTAGWPLDVCMSVNGTTAMIAGTPSLTVTMGNSTTPTLGTDTATGNVQALATNGQNYYVRNYVPAATTGYTTYVRAINTGSMAAAVTGQWVYENGTTGTAATLIASLPAGGASTLSAATIEAALGAPTATIGSNRPRLLISAPTNGMNVQTFFAQPNGTISDMTGAQ